MILLVVYGPLEGLSLNLGALSCKVHQTGAPGCNFLNFESSFCVAHQVNQETKMMVDSGLLLIIEVQKIWNFLPLFFFDGLSHFIDND